MCKYCEGQHLIKNDEQDILVTHFVDKRNGRHKFMVTQDSGKPCSITVAVNFCPNCGKELRIEN